MRVPGDERKEAAPLEQVDRRQRSTYAGHAVSMRSCPVETA